MKTFNCLLLSSLLLSTPVMAEGFGVQFFGEFGHDNTSNADVGVGGANLLFHGNNDHGDMFVYGGVGFKTISGYSEEFDGSYPQLVLGVALPAAFSPYVEVGIDPLDALIEEHDDHHDGYNAHVGVGARFNVNRRVSLDIGYKYHYFSSNEDNFTADPFHHNHYHSYGFGEGFGTTAVTLTLGF